MINFVKNIYPMQKNILYITFILSLLSLNVVKASPTLSISFDAVSSDDQSVTAQTQFEGSAPIEVTSHMTLTDADDWSCDYEWRFCHEGGNLDEPYMIRYDESPVVTFSQAGTDSIALYAHLKRGDEEVLFKREYWSSTKPLTIKASESVLTFPNAFSPNNDGKNDYYCPKSFQSITEFDAKIFNRWGQKLYEWNNVRDKGWDGTFNGKAVKQGTYFIYVKARGADGREFTIKKDVNLLRDHNAYGTTVSE